MVTVGFGLMLFLDLPAVSFLALGSLEWLYPPLKGSPEEAEAIVVLSASCDPPDSVRPKATLGSDTMHRCLCAAEVYHRMRPRPVLISGGKVDPESSGSSCISS